MNRRRGNKEGSIYQVSPGRWRAAITVDGGRRKYLFGTTRQEVAKKLSSARMAQERGLLVTAPSQPLARFLDRWLKDSVANRVRPWTYKGYEAVVRNHINPALGNVSTGLLPNRSKL